MPAFFICLFYPKNLYNRLSFMLKKVFYISLLPMIILLTSCGGGMIGGQYQENLAKLDKTDE